MTNFEQISASLIDGQWKVIGEQVEKALAEGVTPVQILDEVLIPSMGEVGRRFKEGEFYVPEVLISAKAMHRAMEVLKPRLVESNFEPVATVALGTVRGDLHDIGKNLVGMMMEGAGFEVVDLGIDVPPVRFVEAVRERPLQIVAMSALLTTTMASMEATIEALKEAGLRDQVKVMVGGAPVTQSFAEDIRADGYAPDAASAVEKARDLLGL